MLDMVRSRSLYEIWASSIALQTSVPTLLVHGKKVLDGVIVILAWTLNPVKKRKLHERALEQGMVVVDTAPTTLETQSRSLTPQEGGRREGENNVESDETRPRSSNRLHPPT